MMSVIESNTPNKTVLRFDHQATYTVDHAINKHSIHHSLI